MQGKDTAGNVLRGCLHLVNLAASGEDDKSLAEFEDVIASFSQKTPNICQRNSKITSLLQDGLGNTFCNFFHSFLLGKFSHILCIAT